MDENRLKHSLAVAKKMIEIGKEYNLNDKELQDIKTRYGENSITYKNTETLLSMLRSED